MMKDAKRYGATAITLHWVIFVLIACGFSLAVYMTGLPLSPQKLKYYSWHKWIGVTVFLLAIVRVAWRLFRPAPPPTPMPVWQRHTAAASHALLYMLILAIPFSGWIYSSADGLQTVYFGLVPLPELLAKDKVLAELLRFIHVMLNYSLLTLVIIHAAAALKHHFVDHDDVLRRMLPFAKIRGEQ